ncbi:MAG TPA: hypothetical protein PK156_36775, partial [Polyangium sp.]|nr:hypothetical protein [Polyangium sp.]
MSKRYAMLVVEGPHDRAFVCRTLECMGFTRFDGRQSGLDTIWSDWKPAYPKYDHLYLPLDMPTILDTDAWSLG